MNVPEKAEVRIVYGKDGRTESVSIDGVRVRGLRSYKLTDGYQEPTEITLTFLVGKVHVERPD